jgi:hypothetical protein
MISTITYEQAVDLSESIRTGKKTDKIVMVIFSMSDCEVCQPWLRDVITPFSNIYDNEIEFVQVYVDKNYITFPPPQVPSIYFFVPGEYKEQHISRLGPAAPDLVKRDLIRLIKMKNEGLSLHDAFYTPIP